MYRMDDKSPYAPSMHRYVPVGILPAGSSSLTFFLLRMQRRSLQAAMLIAKHLACLKLAREELQQQFKAQ